MTPCIEWPGARDSRGYGYARTGHRSDDLRRLAEAATPGPWRRANETAEVPPRVEPHRLVEQDTDPLYSKVVARTYRDKQHEAAADAAYIAAASPDRILALLAERDALLAVAEAARHAGATWDADQSGPYRPWEVYVDDFDALRSALARLDAMQP